MDPGGEKSPPAPQSRGPNDTGSTTSNLTSSKPATSNGSRRAARSSSPNPDSTKQTSTKPIQWNVMKPSTDVKPQQSRWSRKRLVCFFVYAVYMVLLALSIVACAAQIIFLSKQHGKGGTRFMAASKLCSYAVQVSCTNATAVACSNVNCSETTTWNNSDFRRHMLDHVRNVRYLKSIGTKLGKPTNMIDLRWQTELEDVALRWLQHSCKIGKLDLPRPGCSATRSFLSVGHTIAKLDAPWADKFQKMTTKVTRIWAAYEKHVRGDDLFPYHSFRRGTKLANFAQLIWAKSMAIGCAAIKVPRTKRYNTYLMCNFSPAGSVFGEFVYKPGKAYKTNCPPGTVPAKSFLCTIHDENTTRSAVGLERTS